MWFQQSVEAIFFRAFGERLSPDTLEALRRLGIDQLHPRPTYPLLAVAQGIRVVAADVFPNLTREQALHELGEAFVRGYEQTFMGTAILQLMRVIGPTRSLQRLQRIFRTGGNYMDTRFTSLGPRKAEVWVSDVSGLPTFYGGMITRGGVYAAARGLRTTCTPGRDDSCTYLVEWDG